MFKVPKSVKQEVELSFSLKTSHKRCCNTFSRGPCQQVESFKPSIVGAVPALVLTVCDSDHDGGQPVDCRLYVLGEVSRSSGMLLKLTQVQTNTKPAIQLHDTANDTLRVSPAGDAPTADSEPSTLHQSNVV